MGLGQQVHAAEGGVALGDLGQHRLGGVGQDRLGQVVGAQQGEVVAPGQAGHPGHLRALGGRGARPAPATPRSARPGCDGSWPGGWRCVAAWRMRMCSTAVGWRPWAATKAATSLGAPAVDLLGPLGELGHQRLGHAGDLVAGPGRVAPGPGLPADAEGLGEQVGQHPLVQLGQRGGGLEQRPGVEGAPAAVGDRLGPVPDDHVVVQLGVVGPAGPVGERGGHHAGDVLLDDAVGARAGAEHLRLGVGEHVARRPGGGSRR